jgi:hypothetical protein
MVDMNVVYYHIWFPASALIEECEELIKEQLDRLIKGELNQNSIVRCCISGEHCFEIEKFLKSHYAWVEILEVREDTRNEYEGFTLKYLYEDCRSDPAIDHVMYFHTKGSSYLFKEGRDDWEYDKSKIKIVTGWRRLMEWVVIDRWEENIRKLRLSHVTGCVLMKEPFMHFSGNFWWAKAEYIRHISHPIDDRPTNQIPFKTFGDDVRVGDRIYFERWVGIHPDNFTTSFYSLFDPPKGFHIYQEDVTPLYKDLMN